MLVDSWSCPFDDYYRELGAQAITTTYTMPAAGPCVAESGFSGDECRPNAATGGICDAWAFNGDCLDFRDGPADCAAICPIEAVPTTMQY